MLKDRFCACR